MNKLLNNGKIILQKAGHHKTPRQNTISPQVNHYNDITKFIWRMITEYPLQ